VAHSRDDTCVCMFCETNPRFATPGPYPSPLPLPHSFHIFSRRRRWLVATACRLRIAARTSRLGIIAPPPAYRRQRRTPPPPYDATGGSILCSSKGYRIHGGAGPKRSEPTVVLGSSAHRHRRWWLSAHRSRWPRSTILTVVVTGEITSIWCPVLIPIDP